MATDDVPRPVRIIRLLGAAEIALGLALLIAGFAAGVTVLAIVGAVLVASSGTLFVMARTMARQHGGGSGGDSPFGR